MVLPRLLAVLAAFALTATACSFSFSVGGLDYEGLETAIEDDLNAAYAAGGKITVDGVSCPRQDETPTTGDVFICNAAVEDGTVRVEVTVTNDDLDVTYETLDLVYDVGTVEASIGEDFTAQAGFQVTVECPGERTRIVPIGGAFECIGADAQGETVPIRVTANGIEDTAWEVVN